MAGSRFYDIYIQIIRENSTNFEIAFRHVYWDHDKPFNENGSKKISWDCPFKVVVTVYLEFDIFLFPSSITRLIGELVLEKRVKQYKQLCAKSTGAMCNPQLIYIIPALDPLLICEAGRARRASQES